MKNRDIRFLMIDLFCGAGGTTTGAVMSGYCKPIVAVNHDPVAIKSHKANHVDVQHFNENILTLDIGKIVDVIIKWKLLYPNAKVILWASLECTNFSNAKGGKSRDADSRTLADGLFRYLDALGDKVDYLLIENVKEFMSWGPLVPKVNNSRQGAYCPLREDDGLLKPVMIPESKTKGRYYIRWCNKVRKYGFNFDYKLLNSADFGGVTIRTRYFGAFYRKGLEFAWPEKTHIKTKKVEPLFGDNGLKKWRPVAEVIDWSDLGRSIFDRKPALVDKTINRILNGVRKFKDQSQIMVCNSPGYCVPATRPIGAICTVNRHAVISPILCSYYSGANNNSSIQSPAPTVTTVDGLSIVSPWILDQYGTSTGRSVTMPAGTVVSNPKSHVCSAFIVNPQYNNIGSSILKPAPTVIANQGSWPLSIATVIPGRPRWDIQANDSDVVVELKTYMKNTGIVDIYMRMLKEVELKQIQGFPRNYILHGKSKKRKHFIGNSVETSVMSAWMSALAKV